MNNYTEISMKALACLLVFGVSPAFAGDDAEAVANTEVSSSSVEGVEALKGFTVGFDVVYSHADVRHSQVEAKLNIPASPTDDAKTQINQSRCFVDPSVNIGYSHFKDKYYVGVAGDLSYGKEAKVTNPFGGGAEAETKIERASYGVKLKGGYYSPCVKTLFYGIVGVKWRGANFKYKTGNKVGDKAKVKTPFFVLGLGMERPIRNKLSFSAEYECAWRNSTDTATTVNTSVTVDQRLRENTLKLGVKYHI